jgi:hypothetical protein
MKAVWIVGWVAVSLFFIWAAHRMAVGRSNAAKGWAQLAGDIGPLALLAILFTKKTKTDA